MTQMEAARAGQITAEMRTVAGDERIDIELLRKRIASGEVVIPKNKMHGGVNPVGIGKGLRTKVNANIGTSTDYQDIANEVAKARAVATRIRLRARQAAS